MGAERGPGLRPPGAVRRADLVWSGLVLWPGPGADCRAATLGPYNKKNKKTLPR